MDLARQIERSRIKAFYRLLVERLGEQAWAKRKAAYEARVREKEDNLNLALPIEFQLFEPEDGDVDWYILACEQAYDVQESDSAYSSKRVGSVAKIGGSQR